jgi:hypothetical protein
LLLLTIPPDWQSKRQIAASSLIRNNGADAYEAVRWATAHVSEDERADIMSIMFIAVAEGRLKLSEASARVGEFLRIHRRHPRVLGDKMLRLDAPLGEDSNSTWLDTLSDADRLWA